jgi:flagellar protein FlaG
METKVASVAAAPDLAFPQPQPAPAATPHEPPATDGPDPTDLRLVIDLDQASGTYVYKTVNRLTGEVLQQLPRAEVLKLRDQARYEAGGVIRTTA